MQAPNRVQDGLQAPAELVIVAIIEALEVNFVEINPVPQVLQDLWSPVPVRHEGRQQPGCTGFLEARHRPFAGDQGLIVRAHQDLGALLKRLPHELLRCSSQWGNNRLRVTKGLGCYPILTVATVQVTAQHSEAVGQCPGIGVEEWLFFDRVALHYTCVAPRNVQGSASVVANFTDAGLAFRNGAAVTTSKTAHPAAVQFFVKFTLVHILVNDIPQRRHTTAARSGDCQVLFYRKLNGRGEPEHSRHRVRQDHEAQNLPWSGAKVVARSDTSRLRFPTQPPDGRTLSGLESGARLPRLCLRCSRAPSELCSVVAGRVR